jgi:hypothetical protein
MQKSLCTTGEVPHKPQKKMADNCFTCTHYDLVVIGAGPHALALVSRLLERWPSSIISDAEHSRLHHLHSGKSHKKGLDKISPLLLNSINKRILVIDKYGEWMAKWDKSFRAYDIDTTDQVNCLILQRLSMDVRIIVRIVRKEGASISIMQIGNSFILLARGCFQTFALI